jgi:hypothetical protein
VAGVAQQMDHGNRVGWVGVVMAEMVLLEQQEIYTPAAEAVEEIGPILLVEMVVRAL